MRASGRLPKHLRRPGVAVRRLAAARRRGEGRSRIAYTAKAGLPLTAKAEGSDHLAG